MIESGVIWLKGIILFAYGAPASMDDLPAYYTHIQSRKASDPAYMERVRNRFYQIGTSDTLGSITKRQAAGIEHALNAFYGQGVKVYTAYRHTPPFMKDVIDQMSREGITEIYTFSLKPIESKQNTRLYEKMVDLEVKRLQEETGKELHVAHIKHRELEPRWIDVMADRVAEGYSWLPEETRRETAVIFTAHSIAGKPEARGWFHSELKRLAGLVAEKAEIDSWSLAYRSAGKCELWAGPDVKDVVRQKAAAGAKGILIFDLQSLTFNIEVAYDLGYDLQELAAELGIRFMRAVQPDDSYDFIIAVSGMIHEFLDKEAAQA